MYQRIIAALAGFILFFSGWASAEGLSIIDFPMHKVVPVQDKADVKPVFNPEVNKKPRHEQTTKVVQKEQKAIAKPTEKHAKQVLKDEKVIKKYTKPVLNTPKIEAKAAEPEAKVAEADIKDEEAFEEPVKNENNEGFNKEDIVKNLNKQLDEDMTGDVTSDSGDVASEIPYKHSDYVFKPILSLGIVMVLIFLFAWLYNKLRGFSANSLFAGKFKDMDINQFKVLASSALGQGKIIHLVEINGKQLVIGSTNTNINILTEINPEDMQKLYAKAEKKAHPVDEEEPEYEEEVDELEYIEPESYSARHSSLYKDYLDKE